MKIKIPELTTLIVSLITTIGLPAIATIWVHQHMPVYIGIVVALKILHSLLPSVIAAPSDSSQTATGLNSKLSQ